MHAVHKSSLRKYNRTKAQKYKRERAFPSSVLILLLLGAANSLPLGGCGGGVLSSHPETPGMSQPTMGLDLLQPFQILTKFVLQTVSEDLRVLAILYIFRTIQVVVRNLVLSGVLHDGDESFYLFIRQFTSTFVHVDVSLLETDVGEPSSNSL